MTNFNKLAKEAARKGLCELDSRKSLLRETVFGAKEDGSEFKEGDTVYIDNPGGSPNSGIYILDWMLADILNNTNIKASKSPLQIGNDCLCTSESVIGPGWVPMKAETIGDCLNSIVEILLRNGIEDPIDWLHSVYGKKHNISIEAIILSMESRRAPATAFFTHMRHEIEQGEIDGVDFSKIPDMVAGYRAPPSRQRQTLWQRISVLFGRVKNVSA